MCHGTMLHAMGLGYLPTCLCDAGGGECMGMGGACGGWCMRVMRAGFTYTLGGTLKGWELLGFVTSFLPVFVILVIWQVM
jgi:hypothetical protein